MAEKNDKNQDDKNKQAPGGDNDAPLPPGAAEAAARGELPVSILAQYVRDISFENPNTPDSLRAGQGAPEMSINIGMDARKLEDPQIPNLYEVVVSANAVANRKEQAVFIAEILYGATVSIHEKVPKENHHPLLLIEVPHQIFPHVRQILSDLTMQGGYPPLLLNPVDFHGLYMQRFANEMAEDRKKFEEGLADAEKAEKSV